VNASDDSDEDQVFVKDLVDPVAVSGVVKRVQREARTPLRHDSRNPIEGMIGD